MSENVEGLLGYTASEFMEDRNFWRNHVHPEDQERAFSQVDRPDSHGRSVFDFRFLKKDGHIAGCAAREC